MRSLNPFFTLYLLS